jgi:hypothetical protein
MMEVGTGARIALKSYISAHNLPLTLLPALTEGLPIDNPTLAVCSVEGKRDKLWALHTAGDSQYAEQTSKITLKMLKLPKDDVADDSS